MSELSFFLTPLAKERGITLGVPRLGDAGFDLQALEPVVIPIGGFCLVSTGLHLAIPLGWVGLIRDRSSVAMRGGLVSAGVIDSSYRGEVRVAMHNLGKEPLSFAIGERMAQCLIIPYFSGEVRSSETLQALGETARGQGGFGSTGK